ncbi:MAG: cupin domain-containing protein [Pseudomonadales bacterium]
MQLRADYDETVWDYGPNQDDATWHPSPLPGVERYLLDRDGDEVAVATSLVRYAPNSHFDPHSHALGEEYLVLEGEFADEHGRYGPGTYVRNPAGTAHTPFSDPGCVIWVKLRQFHPADQEQCVLCPELAELERGTEVTQLHRFAAPDDSDGAKRERVALLRLANNESLELPAAYGMQELFVISGALLWQDEQTHTFGSRAWLRLGPGRPLRIQATAASSVLWKERPLWERD